MLRNGIKYNVLFTGGLDSTYRLCQLAKDENAIIQPIYIICPDNGKSSHVRPELQKEIEAQDKILQYLINHPNTKAKFLPIERVYRDDIVKDLRVFELESVLGDKYKIGWQYLYFTMLAKLIPNLELCHEDYPTIQMKKDLVLKKENGVFVTDVEKTVEPLKTVFQDIVWSIFTTTRKQMVEDIKAWNYKDIFDLITFCYRQVDGKPCGYCNNCRAKIEQGLLFLFSKEAIHRFLIFKYVLLFYPRSSLPYFDFYMHKSIKVENFPFTELRTVNYYFRLFKELDIQRNSVLIKEILNPSMKLGYFFKWGTRRVDEWRKDKENQCKYREIFTCIRKNKEWR